MVDNLAEAIRLRQLAEDRVVHATKLLAAALRHEHACREQDQYRHEHPAYEGRQ